MAAELGDPEAQYALGVLYSNLLEDQNRWQIWLRPTSGVSNSKLASEIGCKQIWYQKWNKTYCPGSVSWVQDDPEELHKNEAAAKALRSMLCFCWSFLKLATYVTFASLFSNKRWNKRWTNSRFTSLFNIVIWLFEVIHNTFIPFPWKVSSMPGPQCFVPLCCLGGQASRCPDGALGRSSARFSGCHLSVGKFYQLPLLNSIFGNTF